MNADRQLQKLEGELDGFIKLANYLGQTSTAAIMLLDEGQNRLVLLAGHFTDRPNDSPLCEYTIKGAVPLMVEDVCQHPLFSNDPLAQQEPPVRFFAGFPLRTADDRVSGVLSVMDAAPRTLGLQQQELLQTLAQQVASTLELKRQLQQGGSECSPEIGERQAADPAGLQEFLQTGSWEIDPAMEHMHWSPEVFEIFGATREQFNGTVTSFLSFVHPDDVPTIIAAQEKACRHGQAMDLEHRIVKPDGQVLHVRQRAQPVHAGSGDGCRLLGMVEALTRSIADENHGRGKAGTLAGNAGDSRNLFRLLFESAPELYVVLTPEDYRIVAASNARLSATMARREDIIGKKLFDLFPDDPADPDASGVRNLKASLEYVKRERVTDVMAVQHYPISRPESEGGGFVERYWTPINSPVLDSDGTLAFIIHRVEDVTEYVLSRRNDVSPDKADAETDARLRPMEIDIVLRSAEIKRLADMVRKSKQRFRSAFTNLLVGFSFTGMDKKFIEVNARFAEITGYSQEELCGMNMADITHPDDIDDNEGLLKELLDGSRANFQIEKRYLHKNGGVIWVHNYVTLIHESDSRPSGIAAITIDITQKKAMSEKLEQSEALLRIAGRLARVGGWSVELARGEVTWSDEVYVIHELPPGAPVSMDAAFGYYAPASRKVIREAFGHCVRTGTTWDLELEVITAKGRRINVRTMGEAQWDTEGRIVRVHGAFLDISDRKKNELALEALADRLESILESIADGFFTVDRDWHLTYINSEAERLWQRSRKELMHRSLWDMFPEVVNTSFYHEYQRAALERRKISFEDYFAPWNKWFEINAYPFGDGMSVYFQDVTERRKGEEKLREQAALLDEATDAIMVRSLENRILYWNKAAERRYGWKAEEVLGRYVMDVLYSSSQQTFQEALEIVIRDGDFSGRVVHTRRDGSRVVVQSHWILVKNEDGSPRSILAIHTDLTDKIDLEERLLQKQKLESLGQLTGGIAHDFNNLLTVIIGSAELLVEEAEGAKSLIELAEMIRTAGEKGAELTHRLLAFARRQTLEPEVVDPGKLVDGMQSLLDRTLGKNIVLDIVRPAGTWAIFVDRVQLESAILNLCINARDAMPDGGTLTVEVGNERLDEDYAQQNSEVAPGDYAMIAVTDTGVGMSREVVARAFEPFFTTKEEGKGSGLGLSMVYGFASQSKGHVRIHSEQAHGTTVKIYLPRSESKKAGKADARSPVVDAGGPEHILMVEDDDLVRAHGSRLLTELGYHVVTAGNGPEALSLLKSGVSCDLLFTDMVMPGGMNGLELAREAGRLRPGLPVLFTSGYVRNPIDQDGQMDAGINLLHKPYRRQILSEKIRATLDEQRGVEQ